MTEDSATLPIVLRAMNQALARVNDDLAIDTAEHHANVMVLGLPRSGTTLATQVLFENMDLACTNNLMARFWMAPLVGCCVSRAVVGNRKGSAYKSDYGKTDLPWEPHEFSWFWHDLLGLQDRGLSEYPCPDSIDWPRVHRRICAINNCLSSPVVHKPLEHVGFYLREFARLFCRTLFVYIDRSPIDVACSIARARLKHGGNTEFWYSTELPDRAAMSLAKERPYWVQIAAQVSGLRAMYEDRLCLLSDSRVVRVQYEDLVRRPIDLLEQVRTKTRYLGAEIAVTRDPGAIRPSNPEPDHTLVELLIRGFDALRP